MKFVPQNSSVQQTHHTFYLLALIFITSLSLGSCQFMRRVEGRRLSPPVETAGKNTKKEAPDESIITVNETALPNKIGRVAVSAFRGDDAGAGKIIADIFSDELGRDYKYIVADRGKVDKVIRSLQKQRRKGKKKKGGWLVKQIGKSLDVEGLIVGRVRKYRMQMRGDELLPTLLMTIRMVDVRNGTEIWKIKEKIRSRKSESLSRFARGRVKASIDKLITKLVEQGDTHGFALPKVEVLSAEGRIRRVGIEIRPEPVDVVAKYLLFRSGEKNGSYTLMSQSTNKGNNKSLLIVDENLLDNTQYYYKISSVSPTGLESDPAGPLKLRTSGFHPAVNGFKAYGGEPKKIPLSWEPSEELEIAGYAIYRAEHKTGPFRKIAKISDPSSASYIDTGRSKSRLFSMGKSGSLKSGKIYFYKIAAINSARVEGVESATIFAKTKEAPLAPATLAVAPPGNEPEVKQIRLVWKPAVDGNVAKYELFQGESAKSVDKKIATLDKKTTEFVVTGLGDGRTVFFSIRVIDADGLTGKLSKPIMGKTRALPPAPAGLVLKINRRGITLTWDRIERRDISGYQVSVKNVFGWKVIGQSTDNRFYYDKTPEPEQAYTFRVSSIDESNLLSKPSKPVRGTAPASRRW